MKITKQMMIKEIFLKYPDQAEELASVLSNAGVKCVSCCASAWETLEEGLKGHGMSDEQIDQIIEKLNQVISK